VKYAHLLFKQVKLPNVLVFFFGLGVSFLKDHAGCPWQPAAA